MQNYIDIAKKNGVTLLEGGSCQFCGANTTKGIHECVEIFSLGFQVIDYSKPENHFYRFLAVDAHTLQHSEIHGRWNNHFHLTRQQLMLNYGIHWNYALSPKLSDYLNAYKAHNEGEYIQPPNLLERGNISTTDVLKHATNEIKCKKMIVQWAKGVYAAWQQHHKLVDSIANGFLKRNEGQRLE